MGRAAVLGAAALFAAGCTHTITLQERTGSFARYETATIQGIPAREFLLERTAVLVAGVDIKATPGTELAVEFAMKKPTDLGFGTATVIDSRGYLLTAGHCVTREPVFLFFRDESNQGRFERARIVWQGDPDQKQADLAVLHVPHTLTSKLDWATDFKPGDAVLAAGLNYDEAHHFDSGCLAGELTRIDRLQGTGPAHDQVYHQAPLHGGDSGGPLTTTDGRLIGINTGSGSLRVWPFLWLVARAERPDVAWLRGVIDEDFVHWHQGVAGGEK